MEGSANISDDAKMEDSPEESSWTFYIEGFMCDQENNFNDDDEKNNTSFSSDLESPSLVSDAASSAVLIKKLTNNCNNWTEGLGFSSGKNNNIIPRSITCKQSSFKKQKTKVDYALEDTASSPVNSPKVSYMNQFMSKKEKAKMDVVSEVKLNGFTKDGVFHAVGRDIINYTDLKKRTCG